MPESASAAPAATNGTPARAYIGGQAVLEGVMMRAPTSFAIVVRRRDGSLHVRERAMTVGEERKGFAKLPLARGIASLVESLRLGSEALKFSAEQMERDIDADDEAAPKPKPKEARASIGTSLLSVLKTIAYTLFLLISADGVIAAVAEAEPKLVAEPEPKGEEKKGRGSMTFMLVIMVGFIIALPQAAAMGVNKWLHLNFDVQSPPFQALTGAFKLTIVIGYLLLVRNVFADIRRVFQYHGAEHKTISTYEAGEALTVANARKKTTLHPRCGTTFLVMVALVSILVFIAVGGFCRRFRPATPPPTTRFSSWRSCRSCRSSRRSRSRSSACSPSTARRVRSGCCSGRGSSARRSRPSSRTTSSSRSRSRRSARRSSARPAKTGRPAAMFATRTSTR